MRRSIVAWLSLLWSLNLGESVRRHLQDDDLVNRSDAYISKASAALELRRTVANAARVRLQDKTLFSKSGEPLPVPECRIDTGGRCRMLKCWESRNAECVEGICVCKKGTCSVNGKCVDDPREDKDGEPGEQNANDSSSSSGNVTAEDTATGSQGTAAEDKPGSENSVTENDSKASAALELRRTVANVTRVRLQDETLSAKSGEPSPVPECRIDTGGRCRLLACWESRNAQCVDGICVCKKGCSVNGKCVDDPREDKDGEPDEQNANDSSSNSGNVAAEDTATGSQGTADKQDANDSSSNSDNSAAEDTATGSQDTAAEDATGSDKSLAASGSSTNGKDTSADGTATGSQGTAAEDKTGSENSVIENDSSSNSDNAAAEDAATGSQGTAAEDPTGSNKSVAASFSSMNSKDTAADDTATGTQGTIVDEPTGNDNSVTAGDLSTIDEDILAEDTATTPACRKDTGGTCRVFVCSESRDAECVEGICVCRKGACSQDGKCVSPLK